MLAINPKIKQKAEDIRKKIFGAEVRESLASGLEGMSEDVESIKDRQGNVENQFQDVLDETTDKDVISAPELIAARNGKSNLKTRLDDEHAQVTAQLQQMVIQIDESQVVDDDYSDAINDALSKITVAGTVILPVNKKLKISKPLQIESGTTIDFSNSVLLAVGDFRPISIIGTADNPVRNVHVKNVTIDLDRYGTNQSALYFDHAEDCTWSNISIDNPGLNGVEIVNSKRIHGDVAKIMTPRYFGVFYYLSEDCTDSNVYVYRPKSFGHQFKSSKRCKSLDLIVVDPQDDHALYMWTGLGDGQNAIKINEFCGYIRPHVTGTTTSKHLIYINSSPNCYVDSPILFQQAGGWSPIVVTGTNFVESEGTVREVSSTGVRITNPHITCSGGTNEAIAIVGTVEHIIDFILTNPVIKNGGNKPIIIHYSRGTISGGIVDGSSTGQPIMVCKDAQLNVTDITLLNSLGTGIIAEGSSDLKLTNPTIRSTKEQAIVIQVGSRVTLIGGRIVQANGGSFIIRGNKSIIRDVLIEDSLLESTSYNPDVRVYGSNNIISALFDRKSTTLHDSYIKEYEGARINKYPADNMFVSSFGANNIILTAESGSIIY